MRMFDEQEQKDEEQARSAVERGKQAQQWLEKREAQKALGEADSLAAFKRLSPSARTAIYRTDPARYKQLAEAWRSEAESHLMERSGR
jgi:hypothetical protein